VVGAGVGGVGVAGMATVVTGMVTVTPTIVVVTTVTAAIPTIGDPAWAFGSASERHQFGLKGARFGGRSFLF
jgi:hypothetical protein